MPRIDRETAGQIAESIREACGYDINFITERGFVLASTDPSRIGSYHEIGARAAAERETIEVSSDNLYDGTLKGVNIPIIHHHQLLGVIGISGEPEEVRRYGHLALRIMRLILREKELDSSREAKRAEAAHVVQSLIAGDDIHPEYITEFLQRKKLDPKAEYRAVIVTPLVREGSGIAYIDDTLDSFFSSLKGIFWAFEYPRTYIVFIASKLFDSQKDRLKELSDLPAKCAVGSSQRLARASVSWRDAMLALRSAEENFSVIDDLSLELLFSSVTDQAKDLYLAKVLKGLDEKELHILDVYLSSDMSLKETSEKLFIHKNTLQYQLERIHALCGLNPRVFSDALRLSIAMMLRRSSGI